MIPIFWDPTCWGFPKRPLRKLLLVIRNVSSRHLDSHLTYNLSLHVFYFCRKCTQIQFINFYHSKAYNQSSIYHLLCFASPLCYRFICFLLLWLHRFLQLVAFVTDPQCQQLVDSQTASSVLATVDLKTTAISTVYRKDRLFCDRDGWPQLEELRKR